MHQTELQTPATIECPSWCNGIHPLAETAVLGKICDRVVASRDGLIVALTLDPAIAAEPVVVLIAPDLDIHLAMQPDLAHQMLTILSVYVGGDEWLSESMRKVLDLLTQD